MQDYAEWARYLHIPIGNIPNDAGLLGLDLFFARHLQRAGYALWASPTSRPDLGGKELDDLRLSISWNPLSQDHAVLLNRRCFNGEACVELELRAVAVTALVQRGRLLEAEGADDTVAFDSTAILPADAVIGIKFYLFIYRNSISAYDEGAAVDATLKILKHMLTECLRDIAHSANRRADQVVMSLSRYVDYSFSYILTLSAYILTFSWLHSPTSLLFDPAITRSVSVLERKLVLLLAAECERLGSKVIHATPTRLVLCTGKTTLEQAEAFVELLIQSLGHNPLFAALHIRTKSVWSALLWHDGHNFTGISEKLMQRTVINENGTENIVKEYTADTTNHWRLSDALPESNAVRDEFRKIVSGYVMLYIQSRREVEFDAESATVFRSDLINKEIGHRLFRVVTKLVNQKSDKAEAGAALVEMVCILLFCILSYLIDNLQIYLALSCDAACEDAVDNLRDNLRRILNGLIPPPIPSTSSDVDIGDNSAWTCIECQKPFSKDIVDSAVAERLNQLITAYLLQDHICGKCKAIRRDNLAKFCDCSGIFVNTIDSGALKHDVEAAAIISEMQGLPRSSEIAHSISYILCIYITGFTGISLNAYVIYLIFKQSPPHMIPYKYLLLNVSVHNFLSPLTITLLFQPVPMLDRLSVITYGLGSILGNKSGHVMLAVTVFFHTQLIASVDLCAVFRFYSIRGNDEKKIIKKIRFIWDSSVGYIYSICFAIIIYLSGSIPLKCQNIECYSCPNTNAISQFTVRLELAVPGGILLFVGLLHSAGPNAFFIFYVFKKLKLGNTMMLDVKETIRNYMKLIAVQYDVPLHPPTHTYNPYHISHNNIAHSSSLFEVNERHHHQRKYDHHNPIPEVFLHHEEHQPSHHGSHSDHHRHHH
uniref:DNA polymerase epsilon catalytic subunit n=1 Tax=Heterorhabditis bacteriophora TaxID=37862 RepID=A0A1I7WS66_HETBA